ncbi:MAG: divalent-cation tolerance protein CutA [Rickettsiales bacterium]|nr:divalent-cation tolerance protein CutA [Pseudomonadota bacterium]MDA0966059.1 divalent-cation tolerance protein CutA [Pseudomonadota bacterium]MDG4544241.1 divalent-cation tolerance protein CutA [Rickettsiales bacterium]MDG4546420.1 divalent-cation tolerance protein CutA [Rickettsiales bacterium]MDG4548566.1 divalent-cation tolerance protein CutA [Rickettsiales bacterium]
MHIIYITAPSKEEALKISHSLITEKLVACCNIIDGVTSVYEWEGEIKQDPECIIIAKTSSGLVDNIIEYVKYIHPYECPCVISVKTDKSDNEFSKWVESCCHN